MRGVAEYETIVPVRHNVNILMEVLFLHLCPHVECSKHVILFRDVIMSYTASQLHLYIAYGAYILFPAVNSSEWWENE